MYKMNNIVPYNQYNDDNEDYTPKVHVDFNVIELPLFSKNRKVKHNVSVRYVISKKQNIVVEVIPVAGMSIPTDFDRKVYFAIVQIALEFKNKHKFDEIPTTIYTTFYEIYSKLNLQWFGGKKEENSYAGITKRIYDSLSKLSGTKYKLLNCFYDAKKTAIENDLYESTFIHSIRIKTKENAQNDKDESVKYINTKSDEIITLELNPFFLDNLLHAKGHLKHDFKELQRLDDDVAFSVYWYCDKNRKWLGQKEFGTDKKMKISAKALASKIPLSFTPKNISYSVKRIGEAFQYLKVNKFIYDYEIKAGKKLSETEYIVLFKFSRYNKEYNQTGQENLGVEQIDGIDRNTEELTGSQGSILGDEKNYLIEKSTSPNFNVKKPSSKKDKEIKLEFINPQLTKVFKECHKILKNETIELINNKYQENGLLYLQANLDYTIEHKPYDFSSYLKKALEENYSKTKFSNNSLSNKQQQNPDLNKHQIEHDFQKLNSTEEKYYTKHYEYLMKKNKELMTQVIDSKKLENNLLFCIYAVSNKMSYDTEIESHLKNNLNINLSIYKNFVK